MRLAGFVTNQAGESLIVKAIRWKSGGPERSSFGKEFRKLRLFLAICYDRFGHPRILDITKIAGEEGVRIFWASRHADVKTAENHTQVANGWKRWGEESAWMGWEEFD